VVAASWKKAAPARGSEGLFKEEGESEFWVAWDVVRAPERLGDGKIRGGNLFAVMYSISTHHEARMAAG
jgi:hypothetical protein